MSLLDWLWNLFQPKAVGLRVLRAWPISQVALLDKAGRVTARRGVVITVRGQVAGRLLETTDNGVATFATITLTGSGTVRLTFESAGLTSASVDIVVVVDPANVPTALKVAIAPPASVVDKAFFPVAIQLVNSAGGNVAKAGVAITPTAPAGFVVIHQAGKGPAYPTDATGLASFTIAVDDTSL